MGQRIFICLGWNKRLLEVDLETKFIKAFPLSIYSQKAIYIKDSLHLIGRDWNRATNEKHFKNNHYFLYNKKKNTAQNLHTFDGLIYEKKRFLGNMLYLKSRRSVILFDSQKEQIHEFQTWNNQWIKYKMNYHLTKEETVWKREEDKLMTQSGNGCPIHQNEGLFFDYLSNPGLSLKCSVCNDAVVAQLHGLDQKITTTEPHLYGYRQLKSAAIISSENEKHIFILGGLFPSRSSTGSNHKSDMIFVYNVKRKILQKSPIKCPRQCKYKAVMMRNKKRDELMVFGFINQCFESAEYQNIQRLPYYLVRFIAQWISNEWIHLMVVNGHWKIHIDEVLNSTN